MTRVLVSGASSLVGGYVLPLLLAHGYDVTAISRNGGVPQPGLAWRKMPLEADRLASLPLEEGFVYLHLAPLWLLPPLLPILEKHSVARIIAFSSTSVLSKIDSDNTAERELIGRLLDAEQALQNSSLQNWTIFRPTLIYAAGRDKNVAVIAGAIRKLGFFPVIGSGCGRRQPVHAEDLGIAVMAALQSEASKGKTYSLSGGETLSYREMVGRIFLAMQRPRRIITIPAGVFWLALSVARLLPRFRHLNIQMVYRMNQDLCFAHDEATRDFGYCPRNFEQPLD